MSPPFFYKEASSLLAIFFLDRIKIEERMMLSSYRPTMGIATMIWDI